MKTAIIILLLIFISKQLDPNDLRQQIQNTYDLINLYQKKYELLSSLYKQHYPHLPYQIQNSSVTSYKVQDRLHSNLVFLQKFQNKTYFMPENYLINNNRIISIENSQTISQFFGDVLIIQSNRLTTLVGGKLGMNQFIKNQESIKKQQFLIGFSADSIQSIWHRNLNIIAGQDLLIQWQGNTITLRGKQTQQIKLQNNQKIINIYSLNQYKIVYVSNKRIGIINTRSHVLGDFDVAYNLTRLSKKQIQRQGNQTVEICQVDKYEHMFYILLNTGEIVRYVNQFIVSVQMLTSIKNQFRLQPNSVSIQYLFPYLFIAHKNYSIFKVFSNQKGKFQLINQINLPQNQESQRDYSFFKFNQSIRLLASYNKESYIFEVLLTKSEEINTNYYIYIKIIGIALVIGAFVYFKTRKTNKMPSQEQLRHNHNKLIEPRSKGRMPQQSDLDLTYSKSRSEKPKNKQKTQ